MRRQAALAIPGAQEKYTWMLARVDNPDEAVEVLLNFVSRLTVRLAKAKTESEEELISIIQSLGEFVEEGLSYVRDEDAGEFYDDEYESDTQFPEVSAFDYDQVDDADTESLTGSPLQIAPLYGADRRARLTPPPPLVPRNTSVTARALPHKPADTHTTTWELKHLNRKLHDVLSLHNSTAASEYGSEPTEATRTAASGAPKVGDGASGPGTSGSSLSTVDSRLERVAAQAVPSSTHKLSRSPSIRRLAFLKALSNNTTTSNNNNNRKGEGSDTDNSHPQENSHNHHHKHHHNSPGSGHHKNEGIQRHPLATSRTFDDTILMCNDDGVSNEGVSRV
ncbi:hypothetical protein DL89DRAFT_19709 [Linderina pennispora]|uniref:Uncharacterized protein n=1 Tax=Linderina pennispora TaxID=61395 RepID=A0A1Y1WN20_9FUNG|nr:uncharacterized protein DL89DRAFT_19709 [Linderina pennispora]ORX74606.1 hypothetical protein DL89DRAFT_19709 [Linderina pennispora]